MVLRLDREHRGDWRVLSAEAPGPKGNQPQNGSGGLSSAAAPPTPEDTGDLAFEHRASGAIISLNSVCREYRDASLDELSRYLLLGLNTHGPIVSQDIEIDGTKALSSLADAYMTQRKPSGSGKGQRGTQSGDEVPVRVRAVVLRKSGCTYDLMFVARPDQFETLAPTFDRFLKGFHAQ